MLSNAVNTLFGIILVTDPRQSDFPILNALSYDECQTTRACNRDRDRHDLFLLQERHNQTRRIIKW